MVFNIHVVFCVSMLFFASANACGANLVGENACGFSKSSAKPGCTCKGNLDCPMRAKWCQDWNEETGYGTCQSDTVCPPTCHECLNLTDNSCTGIYVNEGGYKRLYMESTCRERGGMWCKETCTAKEDCHRDGGKFCFLAEGDCTLRNPYF